MENSDENPHSTAGRPRGGGAVGALAQSARGARGPLEACVRDARLAGPGPGADCTERLPPGRAPGQRGTTEAWGGVGPGEKLVRANQMNPAYPELYRILTVDGLHLPHGLQAAWWRALRTSTDRDSH